MPLPRLVRVLLLRLVDEHLVKVPEGEALLKVCCLALSRRGSSGSVPTAAWAAQAALEREGPSTSTQSQAVAAGAFARMCACAYACDSAHPPDARPSTC